MILFRLSPHAYPYSRAQLLADEPRLSLSAELPPAELAALATLDPPIRVVRVAATPRPEDSRTERWDEAPEPELINGTYRQAWISRPTTAEEIAAWDEANRPAPPPPDWDRFQAGLQAENGFPAAWSAIMSGDSRPGIALIASLYAWRAAPQAWPQFLGAALACLALLEPSQAAHCGLELLALATNCNLDPAFLAALEAQLEGAST